MGLDNKLYFIETIKKAISADYADMGGNYDEKVETYINILAEIDKKCNDFFLELSTSLKTQEFDEMLEKSKSDAKKELNGNSINNNKNSINNKKSINYKKFRTIINKIEEIIHNDIIRSRNDPVMPGGNRSHKKKLNKKKKKTHHKRKTIRR